MVHPSDGIADGHGPCRVAVIAAPDREQPSPLGMAHAARWYCRAILSATSTATEPESAKKTRSRPAGAMAVRRSASSIAG